MKWAGFGKQGVMTLLPTTIQPLALHVVIVNLWNGFVATCFKMSMSLFCHICSVMWAEILGKQLGRPTRSVAGWLVGRFLAAYNEVLEESAVQLSGIHPGDTVLELGYGPGLGLQSAAKLLTEPTGHLIGVDYSEYMHKVKYEFWQRGIKCFTSGLFITWCLWGWFLVEIKVRSRDAQYWILPISNMSIIDHSFPR